MKKLIILCMAVGSSFAAVAQTTDSVPTTAHQLAKQHAAALKDSLGLTNDMQQVLYQINLNLFKEKRKARAKTMDADTLAKKIQAIENTRDSLYKAVLPVEKYQQYKISKTGILSANSNL